MNAEWWKGKNERTNQEGIFPRSYVRIEEKSVAAPSSYGNVPMDVSQGTQPAEEKKKGTASKIGGKLGNAAIFGAGGMFEIYMKTCEQILTALSSDNWKQHCQLYFLVTHLTYEMDRLLLI